MANWHKRFMGLAEHLSTFSKDPSTRVGAIIVDADHRIVSTGYNGFPRGVHDTPERLADREKKYEMIVHAEINAILFARRSVVGLSLYTWPLPPCSRCAALIINSGIAAVIAPLEVPDRWVKSVQLSNEMFAEAGVHAFFYDQLKEDVL